MCEPLLFYVALGLSVLALGLTVAVLLWAVRRRS